VAWKRSDADTPEPTSYSPRPPSEASSPSLTRRERAVIGPSISIQGDLSGEEDLTILGKVKGKVDVKSNSVTIGETGHVKADVYGKLIIVEGQVEGNLYGGDQIVLRSSGNVQGNLTAPRVALEDGAQFKGAIDMEPKRQGGAGSRPSKPEDRPSSSGSTGSGSSGSSSGSGAKESEAAGDKPASPEPAAAGKHGG
jgi:cytoskeletal protein CcmA (bactofilin family)